MKIFLRIILFLIVLFALYISVLYFISPKPVTEEYATYQDAITGDPMKDHWIPDFVPHSARDIHLRYGLEPSFQRLEFFFAASDESQVTQGFEKVTNESAVRDVLNKIKRGSWKAEPEGDLQLYVPPENISAPERSSQYLAIDPVNRRVWYNFEP